MAGHSEAAARSRNGSGNMAPANTSARSERKSRCGRLGSASITAAIGGMEVHQNIADAEQHARRDPGEADATKGGEYGQDDVVQGHVEGFEHRPEKRIVVLRQNVSLGQARGP